MVWSEVEPVDDCRLVLLRGLPMIGNWDGFSIGVVLALLLWLPCCWSPGGKGKNKMQVNFKTQQIHICDPTRANKADVIRGTNWDFAVNVFYRNQK